MILDLGDKEMEDDGLTMTCSCVGQTRTLHWLMFFPLDTNVDIPRKNKFPLSNGLHQIDLWGCLWGCFLDY